MLFEEIKPFIRYARIMEMDTESHYLHLIPYDARLFYTIKGSGEIEIDGTSYAMTEGSVLIINSAVEYHLKTPKHGVTYLAFNFDYTFSDSDIKIPIPPGNPENFDSSKCTPCSFDNATFLNHFVYLNGCSDFEKNLLSVISECSQNLIFSELTASAIFCTVLAECVRKVSSNSDTDNETVQEILDYIHENYKKNLTNKEIGQTFNFHPNYISSIIKLNTGMPLHQYLLHVKLSHAINMLDEGNKSIKEISDECGFCDIYYFSHYFKNVTGISPNQYRRKQLK